MTGGAGGDTFLFDLTTVRSYSGYTFPSESTALRGSYTVTDFAPGSDVVSFRGTALSAGQMMDRFQDFGSDTLGTAVRGVFTGSDFASSASGSSFEVLMLGVSRSQLTAGSFLASP